MGHEFFNRKIISILFRAIFYFLNIFPPATFIIILHNSSTQCFWLTNFFFSLFFRLEKYFILLWDWNEVWKHVAEVEEFFFLFLTNPLCQHHHETFSCVTKMLYNVLMVKTNWTDSAGKIKNEKKKVLLVFLKYYS